MLDYSKAFDKINISILLEKLKKLGIGGQIGRWLGNFLIGRKQCVSVNKKLSDQSEILSGVPQGTILAPVLFLVYIADIGDMPENTNTNTNTAEIRNQTQTWHGGHAHCSLSNRSLTGVH